MGLGKIIFFIVAPIGGMTIAAFSLKKQLPKACRLFGNYIGLSYVYFKSIIKILKPQDHMTYEMIDMARRASQQSQTLKRQLRNTVKKMKMQIKQKRDQVFKDFQNDFPILKDQQSKKDNDKKQIFNVKSYNNTNNQSKKKNTGDLIIQMERKKKQVLQKRADKKKANKFFEQI